MNEKIVFHTTGDVVGSFSVTYGDFECVECQEHFPFEEELFNNRCETCILDQGEN